MDIVERLRDDESMYDADDVDLHLDAADEIERLRIDLEVEGGRRVKAQLFRNDMLKEIERLRIDLEVEGGRRVKAQLFRNDMLKEIERLRKALQLIAAPSKVVVKGEEAVVALRLVLSSHRRTALKALGEVSDGHC